MDYKHKYLEFMNGFGKCKTMVLSTSLNDLVTSRMMSIVVMNNEFYFQTDNTFRKYKQLIGNKKVALCIDNIQIEGFAEEIGKPLDNKEFVETYKQCFKSSFEKYSQLLNERLFRVTPTLIQRWLYINNIPYIEIIDFINENYVLKQYLVID